MISILQLVIQIENSLFKILGIKSVSDLEVFQILEYLLRLLQLSIPNLKIQNMKCSELQTVLELNLKVSGFRLSD
jgi:hypothetical protein